METGTDRPEGVMPAIRRRLRRSLGTVLFFPYRLLLRLWWRVLPRIRCQHHCKRVLLCPANDLMAEYVGRVAGLVRKDDRLAFHLTAPIKHVVPGSGGPTLARNLGVPHVRYMVARFLWWDLIIFASSASGSQFHPRIPKILTNHSIAAGKILGGVDAIYGPSLLHDGQCMFTTIFEAGRAVRDDAVRNNPCLEGHVAVVGDLRADEMVELNGQRDRVRGDLGFASDDVVVLIQSTWGTDSLMETMGRGLLGEAMLVRDQGGYKFLISVHPNNWGDSGVARRHPWGRYALDMECDGFRVIRPHTDWAPALVAADVAITDHTSLAATFSLLNKPMAFVPLRNGLLVDGTMVKRLYDELPHIDRADRLEEIIRQVRSPAYPIDRHRAIAGLIVSYPGEAAARMRAEIYRLLDLSETEDREPHHGC